MLKVRSLSKSFGGIDAVSGVTFAVQAGTVHAVIGPNGAGKTTLFNLISGVHAPSAGEVLLGGEPVTGRRPEELARRGLSRTFQNLQVCMNMSAVGNVMVGAHLGLDGGLVAGMLRLPPLRRAEAACRAVAGDLMEFVGVGRYAAAAASQLPYGALKRLEIARALAARPKLLLLDEPAAGLNESETAEIGVLIRRIAATGITVLLVEHDMKLVMELSDRVLVMDHGAGIAQGTPAQVRSDPAVVAAYLGSAV